MKNEQVNQIKAGVVRELKDLLTLKYDQQRDDIIKQFQGKIVGQFEELFKSEIMPFIKTIVEKAFDSFREQKSF